jgi:poly-gamma-glutamate synthesis protein (capsule biosynthesis protein)
MRRAQIGWQCLLALLVVSFLVVGCGVQAPLSTVAVLASPAVQPTAGMTPIPPSPTATETAPVPTATQPASPTIWLADYLPQSLVHSIQLAEGVVQAQQPEEAQYLLQAGNGYPLSQWFYALVAPFPTIPDGLSLDELQGAWQGKGAHIFVGAPLLMDESTWEVFQVMWGPPAEGAVMTLPGEELLEYAWQNQPSWAIMPFEALEARWKVLAVDGVSPIDQDFDPAAYPLKASFSLQTNPDYQDGSGEQGSPQAMLLGWQPTNREAEKMTSVMLTGVTALVRATAETMRRKGVTNPAQDIRHWLRSADITHVSNEVPFAKDCPTPDAWQTDLVFCSNPAYIDLLVDIGTDVVELTGDHFGDWGAEAMRFTLDLYHQYGIPYYGGGYDLEDARKPWLVEHHGNRLAFIGCNAKAPGYGTARENNPGAIYCDFDWLTAEIRRLKSEGYLPIVTFQHIEYYTYVPQPKLIEDFRAAAQAGAVIVSGSQAHQPHGMEFYQEAFIHYGLGNLFFDQYHMGLPTGQGFIDRHVFYDGRYISTELLGIRFVDFARARPMTAEERQELLQSVFDASLW